MTIVVDGLKEDEMVVTDGVDKLKAGSKVQLRTTGEGAGAPGDAAPAGDHAGKPGGAPAKPAKDAAR
jgi:hypothetical protein